MNLVSCWLATNEKSNNNILGVLANVDLCGQITGSPGSSIPKNLIDLLPWQPPNKGSAKHTWVTSTSIILSNGCMLRIDVTMIMVMVYSLD